MESDLTKFEDIHSWDASLLRTARLPTGIPPTVVLKLPTDGPRYSVQKELILSLGVGVDEPIPCDDFDKVLMVARIIKADWVDLHWGCDQSAYYHELNELLALEFILDSMKLSGVENLNSHQFLKAKVVHAIKDLTAKTTKTETRVDSNYKCDRENNLINWVIQHGGRSKVEIVYIEGIGKGAVATEDLEVGDVILDIPLNLIPSTNNSRESEMYPLLEQKLQRPCENLCFALWILKEKHKDEGDFKLLLDTLPEKFNTGLSFGEDAVRAYEDMLQMDTISKQKEAHRAMYDFIFPLLNLHPTIFPPEIYTREQYKWASELLITNNISNAFGIILAIFPVAHLLRTSPHPHITTVQQGLKTFKFKLAKPCKKGDQIYIANWKSPSYMTVAQYGFMLEETNPFDFFRFGIVDHEAILRDPRLSRNQELFHYGLPTELLVYLRSHFCSKYEECTPLEKLGIEDQILNFLEGELEQLRNQRGFDDDPHAGNGDNLSWDWRLVMRLKDNLRGIIDSNIEACRTGKETVKRAVDIEHLALGFIASPTSSAS